MSGEVAYLNFLLFVAVLIGPIMTRRFFLRDSRAYGQVHLVSLVLLSIGFIFSIYQIYFIWILFCIYGFFLYLKKELLSSLSLESLAASIPLVFSIIASVWLFSGANDLQLLGYNREWSLYAALHGNFLGWLLIGSLVVISRVFSPVMSRLYLVSSFLFLLFFLLVAFGIDGVPFIKKIGAFGIIVMTPFLVGGYVLSFRREKNTSFYLSGMSFFSFLATLYLAASNELGHLSPMTLLNIPSMVALHGLGNGLVAVPLLMLALYYDGRIYEST